MTQRLRTVLVGCGMIGAGYARDARMAAYFPYATHAQVLADHPRFAFSAAVDPHDRTREDIEQYSPRLVARDVRELRGETFDVAVLATKPENRLEALDALCGLRAVLVEKPLGGTTREATRFIEACEERGLVVAVNYLRRADVLMRRLADGELAERLGSLQAGFAVYGNGAMNNAVHLVDLVRMLLGEVKAARALHVGPDFVEGPLAHDRNVTFALELASGATVMFQPLRFSQYRENALDLWGTNGRVSILQEGLVVAEYPRTENRSTTGSDEIASDRPRYRRGTLGTAFREMYDDLAAALDQKRDPLSSGRSALASELLVHRVLAR